MPVWAAGGVRQTHTHDVVRTLGEWHGPTDRRPQDPCQSVSRNGEIEPCLLNRRSGGGQGDRLQHLFDRRDARNRLFRKRPQRVRYGTH